MTHWTTLYESPVGPLRIVVDDDGALLQIDLPGSRAKSPAAATSSATRCAHVVRQLREYFAGERTAFDLPLRPHGTAFQQRAWQQLQRIPYGATISYQEQAQRLGNPAAMRAVGGANGRNPIPIVVPCHRVVGKDGSLTGFGGGLACKRWLLRHEAEVRAAAAAR